MSSRVANRSKLAGIVMTLLVLVAAPMLGAGGIKVALKSVDSGNFLGRCNNCIPNGAYPDSAFVHVKPSELNGAHWAHWVIEEIGKGT